MSQSEAVEPRPKALRPIGALFRSLSRIVLALALIIGLIYFVILFLVAPKGGSDPKRSAQMKSASQLRSIGQALNQYAAARGSYPDTLRTLESEYLTPDLFISPLLPNGDHTTSFVYCAGLPFGAEPRTIVAFENPAISRAGINVLYQDGHVEFIRAADIPATLADVKNVQTPEGQPFTIQLPN